MKKVKRTFTPENRESILREAQREGKMETCRKYNGTGHPAIAFLVTQMAT